MSIKNVSKPQSGEVDFDLFRLGESKNVVNLSPNTLRNYHRAGLPFYGEGRTIFVSKKDLSEFIRSKNVKSQPAAAAASPIDSQPDNQGGGHAES